MVIAWIRLLISGRQSLGEGGREGGVSYFSGKPPSVAREREFSGGLAERVQLAGHLHRHGLNAGFDLGKAITQGGRGR